MSEDEEVFFGPVSQEEKKLIRQYGSRRTEIYYQSCPLDRCSLLEFRRKNCLDKNVLFPHSLQQDLMKKHSKTKASYVLENVDIESENDPSNLESSVEISNNAEDITRNTEGMSTLNLTSSRSSASTDVNETSFEPDSLSYFPSEEDSITEDSLQNSVHSNGAFPNLSSSSTFVSISHEDRFRKSNIN